MPVTSQGPESQNFTSVFHGMEVFSEKKNVEKADFHDRGLQLRQQTDVLIFVPFTSISLLPWNFKERENVKSPNKSGTTNANLDWEALPGRFQASVPHPARPGRVYHLL